MPKNITLYLCREYTGEKLKGIGEQFHVSESAVSHAARKVSKIIAKGKRIRKGVEKIIKELDLSRFKNLTPLFYRCFTNNKLSDFKFD